MNVRLRVLLTSAILLVGAAAYAQSASPAPATSQTASERATDDWTGLYAGANFGHVSQTFSEFAWLPPFTGDDGTVFHPGVALGPASAGSATIGFHVGYDTRLTRGLVGGIELQVTHTSPFTHDLGNGVLDNDLRSFRGGLATSARARVGTAITRRLLVYGTAGAAMTSVTAVGVFTLPGVVVSPASVTMRGLVLGVGGEYAPWRHGVLSHLVVGAEFRHVSPDSEAFPLQSLYHPVSTPGTLTSHTNELDVRVNYRFSVRRK